MNAPSRIVLVGFMGAGKSHVGRLVSRSLGWAFYDFDREIERTAGRTISEIFEADGEATFREIEASVGERLLGMERSVLSTGGGWGATPGWDERLPPDTLSIWLRVSPEVAVSRAGRDRPLLEVADPIERARELLQARIPYYRKARMTLDSDRWSPAELADQIVSSVRDR